LPPPDKINVSKIVDNAELGPFRWGLIVLVSLCLIMDGFDSGDGLRRARATAY
jgi:hypothetical protein